jgi:hypothetical protein
MMPANHTQQNNTGMPFVRTGRDYRAALKDGRKVWVADVGAIDDVTTHPVTKGLVDSLCRADDALFGKARAGGQGVRADAEIPSQETEFVARAHLHAAGRRGDGEGRCRQVETVALIRRETLNLADAGALINVDARAARRHFDAMLEPELRPTQKAELDYAHKQHKEDGRGQREFNRGRTVFAAPCPEQAHLILTVDWAENV